MKRLSLTLCTLLMTALALTGCLAKNEVHLLYDTSAVKAAPLATAPRVVVVQFDDARTDPHIGIRKDGTAFQTSSSVSSWVTQALADELTRQGMQVSVALSMAQAQVNQPDLIVGGSVDKVWLTEKNISSYQAEIRVQTRVHRVLQAMQTRTFTATQEKTGIPGAKLAEETLSGTLADVLSRAASSVASAAR